MSFITKRDSWENHVKILVYMKLLTRPAVWSSCSHSDECQVFPWCLAGHLEEMDRMSALHLNFLFSNSWFKPPRHTRELGGKWVFRNGGYKTGLGIQGYKGGGVELGVGREDWEEEGITTYNVLPTYTISQAPFLHTNSYHKCLGPQPLKMAWFFLISPFIPCKLHKKQ